MSDAWQSIKIRRFEYVTAGPTTSLLRLSGKPPWRRGASPRPLLLVDHDGEAFRFAALPAPEDPRGTLQAAYSLPSNLLADDAKFWLEHADGAVTELPQPGPGDSRRDGDDGYGPASPASGPAEDDFDHGASPEERRSDLHAKLAEQSQDLAHAQRAAAESDQARRLAESELARARETIAALEPERSLPQEAAGHGGGEGDPSPDRLALERGIEALRSARASLEKELDQSRDQLRIMTFERDELSRQAAAFDGVAVKARERAAKAEAENEEMSSTLRELEVWRGELERRLAATTSELGMMKAAREADERELKRLRETLAEAESRAERGGPSADSSQTLEAQAAEIELLMAELGSLRAQQADAMSPDRAVEETRRSVAEAERAEIARRAEELQAALQDALVPAQALLELARSGLDAERRLRSAAGD